MNESCSSSTNTSESPPPLRLSRLSSANSSVILDIENGIETESRNKLPSSKFKGVVPQPNGRWGAQIYEKHQRVWLGTFNLQQDAASAYDIAARRFRGPDALTNFINPPLQPAESAFLESHSKSEIVDMLRKHTYADEFEQSKKRFYSVNQNDVVAMSLNLNLKSSREILFEKTVTPSDVGKLNRLVIPKQYAEKHFPLPLTSNGVLINLEDLTGKMWRFRYSYWNSSQSYVLTKGWSRFVKEKNLRAGDVVMFQRSTGLNRELFIDWKSRSDPVKVMVRLFGVDIMQNDVGVVCGGKRSRDVDLFALRCSKKQAIINVL